MTKICFNYCSSQFFFFFNVLAPSYRYLQKLGAFNFHIKLGLIIIKANTVEKLMIFSINKQFFTHIEFIIYELNCENHFLQ